MPTLKDLFSPYKYVETYYIPEISAKKEPIDRLTKLREYIKFTGWSYTPSLLAPKKPTFKLSGRQRGVLNVIYKPNSKDPFYDRSAKAVLVEYQNSKDAKFLSDEIDKYIQEHPSNSKYKDLLMDIAALESNFKQKIIPTKRDGTRASSAVGWFQFLENTRNAVIGKEVGEQDFANNPLLLIDTAVKYIKQLQSRYLTDENINKMKAKGMTYIQGLYLAWWNPQNFLDYVNNKPNYFADSLGTDVEIVVSKAAPYKKEEKLDGKSNS